MFKWVFEQEPFQIGGLATVKMNAGVIEAKAKRCGSIATSFNRAQEGILDP